MLLKGRLFIVKYWLKRYIRRRLQQFGNYEDYDHKMEIVYGNLDEAATIFRDFKAEVQHMTSYSGYFGAAELYEAEFTEHGRLRMHSGIGGHGYPGIGGHGYPGNYILLYKKPHENDIIEVNNIEQFRERMATDGQTEILGQLGGQQA